MLNAHDFKLMQKRFVVRLVLVAFSISVFAAPNTLGDYRTTSTGASFRAYNSYDFITNGGFAENFLGGNLKTQPDYRATSSAIPKPAAASYMRVQSTCAPYESCFFSGCWYNLLNNTDFMDPSCTPNWVFPAGYVLPSSSICNTDPFVTRFKKIAVLPYASGFSQNFFVPYDATGPLEIGLIYAIVGTPTINDRIILEVREGSFLRSRISIRTDGVPTYCHREDYTFPSGSVGGSFAGRNLRLRVSSQIVTPGVEYHISSIFMFGNF